MSSLGAATLGELLDASTRQLTRYVVLPGEAEKTALALFTAHTYAIEGAHATPYLLVTSPERESGKTRMLENLELQVASPLRVTSLSEAAMFRSIEAKRPTLMLDEIDALFQAATERTEGIRALINAGNLPGSVVGRCAGDRHEIVFFNIFCPKVLSGIDIGKTIPETIRSRSIQIQMKRKTGSERVERFKRRFVDAECEELRTAFDAWSGDAVDDLLDAIPELPEELGDRAAEGWEPLLAIADLAGGAWPEKARAAAVELSAPSEDSDMSYGAQLLESMKLAMDGEDRITTADFLDIVNADDELSFGGWRNGNGIDARGVAKHLKAYGVKPRTVDVPGQHKKLKGYLRDELREAWDRWLPVEAVTGVTAVTDDKFPTGRVALESQSYGVTNVTANPSGSNGELLLVTDEEEAELQRIAERFGP